MTVNVLVSIGQWFISESTTDGMVLAVVRMQLPNLSTVAHMALKIDVDDMSP